MEYTQIPGTEFRVSRICLGTMTFGSPVQRPDAVRLIRDAAEECGINFIDTANMYEGYDRYAGSAGGVAEEIVGEAVAHRRAGYIIATKVGMKVGPAPEDENTSPEAIRVQLRRSLARMKTDYVDLYYLHKYDPDTEPHAIARALGAELRAGLIRAWGVSNYTAAQLAALLAAARDEGVPPPALCQPALSMLNTDALEALLPLCEKEGIGVVPYQILQGGMLTGKYRRGRPAPEGSRLAEKPAWMKPFTDEVYDVIERCAHEAQQEGVTMTQYALRWTLAQPGVVSALVGVKRLEQLKEAAAALQEMKGKEH